MGGLNFDRWIFNDEILTRFWKHPTTDKFMAWLHSVGFPMKNGINCCNFWTSCSILTNFFFKCRLLMRLSSCFSWDFGRWQMTCWGSLEGTKEVWWKNFAYFSRENVQYFLFLWFSRMKRLSFTRLLNLSSWRFFGGSIDSLKYSSNIQWDFV